MPALVLFTSYENCIYERLLENYKLILPKEIKEKAFNFRRWQDRQSYLLGKLITWHGLKRYNYEDDCLNRLQVNPYGKPSIDQNIFFNLSHSGQFVVCAFYTAETGIDIEKIEPTDIEDFRDIFTHQEKAYLDRSATPLTDFYRIWTLKESVIKAEGKGLSIPLQQLNVLNGEMVQLRNRNWYMKEINLSPGYCCSLASKKRPSSILIEKLNLKVASK